jgi:hypothetical protein
VRLGGGRRRPVEITRKRGVNVNLAPIPYDLAQLDFVFEKKVEYRFQIDLYLSADL